MSMYNRILVPLDGSPMGEQALPIVRALGTALKVPVELLRVYEPEQVFYWPNIGNYQERTQAAVGHREEVLHSLDPISASLGAAGIGVTANVHAPQSLEGQEAHRAVTPAEHIVEFAGKESTTLIIMCTHGRSGAGRWVMGSVTDKVLHATDNPILIVRSKPLESAPATADIDRIIVPWDGSEVAERIWPHAIDLSQGLGVKLHLIHTIPEDRSHALEEDHLQRIGERLVRDGAHSFDTSLLHGDPANAIVDMTHQHPNALVAMTTHGRSGVGRWVMGSVTDKVVRYAGGAVLVTRAL